MAKKRTPNLVPYDPSAFEDSAGSFAGQGVCSFARFCGGKAEWITSHQGRSGMVRLGLCHEHAVRKVGGEKNLPVLA